MTRVTGQRVDRGLEVLGSMCRVGSDEQDEHEGEENLEDISNGIGTECELVDSLFGWDSEGTVSGKGRD